MKRYKVTLQPHQILHLPRKMNVISDLRQKCDVISNAQSKQSHRPTSPNTAPARKFLGVPLLNCCYYWTVTVRNCYFTEVLLYWTVTLLKCYLTEALLYWTVTVTEVLLSWSVTLLNCYFTELLLYWTVTLRSCYFTELWLYVTELLLYWIQSIFKTS